MEIITKIVNDVLEVYYSDLSKKCKKSLVAFMEQYKYDKEVIDGILADTNVVTYIGLTDKLMERFGKKINLDDLDRMVS